MNYSQFFQYIISLIFLWFIKWPNFMNSKYFLPFIDKYSFHKWCYFDYFLKTFRSLLSSFLSFLLFIYCMNWIKPLKFNVYILFSLKRSFSVIMVGPSVALEFKPYKIIHSAVWYLLESETNLYKSSESQYVYFKQNEF